MQRIKFDLERLSHINPPEPKEKPIDNVDLELDLLPEFCHYRDEGCELAQSCLRCPFPRCVHDGSRGQSGKIKSIRDRQIIRLHNRKKKTVKELAVQYRLSVRTIKRILANQTPDQKPHP